MKLVFVVSDENWVRRHKARDNNGTDRIERTQTICRTKEWRFCRSVCDEGHTWIPLSCVVVHPPNWNVELIHSSSIRAAFRAHSSADASFSGQSFGFLQFFLASPQRFDPLKLAVQSTGMRSTIQFHPKLPKLFSFFVSFLLPFRFNPSLTLPIRHN